jgi:GT2 family glycosyltransferase
MSPPSRPRATFVVLAYNQWPVTERCLQTIVDCVGDRLGGEFELLVVDNGSTDETAEALAAWHGRLRVETLEQNRNCAGGLNAGATAATGEVIVLMNNDLEVTPGALEALVEEALDPTVGAVGVRLLYPNGTIQHAGFGWFGDAWHESMHFFRHEPGNLPVAGAVYDLDAVTGACIAIRRELFHSLGGIDEGFVNSWEDIDLCLRARTAGYRIVYRGDHHLVHHESITAGNDGWQAPGNANRFAGRWAAQLESDEPKVGRLFDACFLPGLPVGRLDPAGAPAVVDGPLTAVAPDAAEARSILRALESLGCPAAVRDRRASPVAARIEHDELLRCVTAAARPRQPRAITIRVGEPLETSGPLVLRLAGPTIDQARSADAVLTATPEAAESLVAAGIPHDRVSWLPPLLERRPCGPGGEGVLALLPADDYELSARIVRALAATPVPARVVPRAADVRIAALVRELLPHAELLDPVADESRLARLATTADLLVDLDPRDTFGRAALLGAQAGATVVAPPDGAAAAVLGDLLVTERGGPDGLAAALAECRARAQLAGRVDAACASPTALRRLAELLTAVTETPVAA